MECNKKSLWNYKVNMAYLAYRPMIQSLTNDQSNTEGGIIAVSQIQNLLHSKPAQTEYKKVGENQNLKTLRFNLSDNNGALHSLEKQ